MTTTTKTLTTLAALALATAGISGCDGDAKAQTTTTSTTTTTATTKASQDPAKDAYVKSEYAVRLWAQLPQNGNVTGNFMTPDFIKRENASRAQIAAAGVKVVGAPAKIVGLQDMQYRTTPDLATVIKACSVGDPRLIDRSGKDVTADDAGNPVPMGQKRSATLITLHTPDDQKTWQVASVQTAGTC